MTNNTNKATDLANMMAEEFKIVGASFNRLAEHMENLLQVVLETPATPVIEEKKTGKPTPKKETVKETPAPVEEVEETEEDEEGLDLDSMTLKELKELADTNEIEYPKGVKKPALIDLIAEALIDNAEEVDEEEVEETDGEEEGELTLEDLAEMSLKELKEIADENEVEYPKAVKKPALLKILEETFFAEEEEGEEEEVEEAEETEEEEVSTVIETEDGEVDLADLNVKELKKFAKDYELEITAKSKDGIIAEILEQIYAEDEEAEEEADEQEEEAEDDGEDVAEQLGLNDMELEELAEILEENGLSTKGKKQALIDRIVRAVEDGTIEIDEEEAGE